MLNEYQQTLGTLHRTSLAAAYEYRATTMNLGYLEDASRWADWAFQASSNTLGLKDPIALKANRIRGEILNVRGWHQEAEDILAGTLVDQQDLLGDEHPDTLETQKELGMVCGEVRLLHGETTAALDMLRRALSNAESLLRRDHPETISIVSTIAFLYSRQDSSGGLSLRGVGSATMRPWMERYVAWLEQRLGLNIPETRSMLTYRPRCVRSSFSCCEHVVASACLYFFISLRKSSSLQQCRLGAGPTWPCPC
jgi:hypothetical protein